MAENFTNSVCGHLAHQLIAEKAEIFKHQAIAKSIQEAIIEKKTSLVRDLLIGKNLEINMRLMTVLKVHSFNFDDNFTISLTLAEEVYSQIRDIDLTRKEWKIVNEYDDYMLKFIDDPDAGWDCNVLSAASELGKLKHRIRLIKKIFTPFFFEDAVAPRFFEQTDIFINGNEFYNGQLIEDTIIRK